MKQKLKNLLAVLSNIANEDIRVLDELGITEETIIKLKDKINE